MNTLAHPPAITRIWSPQQAALIEWCRSGRGSAIAIAVAGAGKTTVSVACAEAFPCQVAFMAYNNSAGKEIKEKIAAAGMDFKKAQGGTVHSFGNAGLRKAFPILKDRQPDQKKVLHIVEEASPDFPFNGMVAQLISLAKQRALGIRGQIDDRHEWHEIIEHFDLLDDVEETLGRKSPASLVKEIIDHAIDGLHASNKMTDLIDFDDMVYLGVYHRIRFWRFGAIILDEFQDTNWARLALAKAMLLPGGRLLAVGDPCQPLGTVVSIPGGTALIEDLKVGDRVVSYRQRDSAFLRQGRIIKGITRRPYKGKLVVVCTENGLVSKYTPNHFCYVNFTGLRSQHAVYIMGKGNQFRIGKAKMSYAEASGLSARMHHEGADAVWLLSLHETEEDAFFQEQAVAGRFGLPQLMFSAKKMMRGPAADYLPRAWGFIGDNSRRAEEALAYFGRDVLYPLFRRGTGKQQTCKRPFVTNACNLMNGVRVLPYEGRTHATLRGWQTIQVSQEHYEGDVISLDVEDTHLYVADGILTRNCQAIYGFTGADASAFDTVRKEFSAVEMPLTVSFRCPRNVVQFARKWVSHIEPHPDAPAGRIETIGYDHFLSDDQLVGGLNAKQADPLSTAVLSRTTKPLVTLAFALIRRLIACKVEGREIGNGLKALATKWKRPKSLPALSEKLKDYLDRETTKLLAKGKEEKIQAIEDQVETLQVLIQRCREERKDQLEDLYEVIDGLFGDDVAGVLTLSTIHKSKGREWNTVYWLDRLNTCPSRWARQAWQEEQEVNLQYVAATRAKETLVEIICPAPEKKREETFAAEWGRAQ